MNWFKYYFFLIHNNTIKKFKTLAIARVFIFLVQEMGLEPTRHMSLDFESSASAIPPLLHIEKLYHIFLNFVYISLYLDENKSFSSLSSSDSKFILGNSSIPFIPK